METALVTGSTGFVGASVTRLLLSKGLGVKALVRQNSNKNNLKDLEVEPVLGDLLDPSSVRKAVVGVKYVFHVAADYRLWAKNPQEIYDANLGGTKTLMEACQSEGVKRIVYTSSVATIGLPARGQVADESNVGTLKEIVGHYKRSKFLAEKLVLEMAEKNLPVVIVNPSTPIGPYDIKPTPTGKIIVDFLNHKMPAYIDTGLNFVDVGDVAQGHWLALHRGRPGSRYILGGENLSLREFLELLAGTVGRKAPKIRIPYCVAYLLGMLNFTWSKLTGFEPAIPLEGVRMAKRKMFFSSAKAVRELGYQHKSIERALKNATCWFTEHGYVVQSAKSS